jgi:hypothetical protein
MHIFESLVFFWRITPRERSRAAIQGFSECFKEKSEERSRKTMDQLQVLFWNVRRREGKAHTCDGHHSFFEKRGQRTDMSAGGVVFEKRCKAYLMRRGKRAGRGGLYTKPRLPHPRSPKLHTPNVYYSSV